MEPTYISDAVEEHALTHLRCSICKHLLSVKPVLIDVRSGAKVCGRCITSSTSIMLIDHSYEILAKQFSFPCAYINEGCTFKKPFEKVSAHERACTYRISRCFCSWTGNTFEFIKHYQEQHENLVINNGDIFNITKDRTSYIFKNEGLYFLVMCLYDNKMLRIHISGVTNMSQESKATFLCRKIVSDSSTTKIALDTIKKFHCQEISSLFTINIIYPDGYKHNIFNSIICPNCNISMTPPILRCSLGHITCVNCTDSWLDYCKVCDTERELTCDAELQCVALAAEFTCRWNCGLKFDCTNIREHELACTKRIFTCWHSLDCNWTGYLDEFVVHDSDCLSNISGNTETCIFGVNDPEITFWANNNDRLIHHLIVYNCSFNVIFDTDEGVTSIYFNHYDIGGFGWFRFEADLKHIDDANCEFNKTYDLSHTHGGIYKTVIPEEDIDKFGGTEFYKIIARVVLLNDEEQRLCTNDMYKHFKNYTPI